MPIDWMTHYPEPPAREVPKIGRPKRDRRKIAARRRAARAHR